MRPRGSRTASGTALRIASDAGAGSVLAISLIGAVIAAVSIALPLYIGLSSRQGVIAAADASALAAADVASGIFPGVPCEIAATVVAANDATLTGCALDGQIATVTATRIFLGIPLRATATAGPPGSPRD